MATKYETDRWPFIQARWYTKTDPGVSRKVRVVVIHDMEFKESPDAAEIIAHDFATRGPNNKGSAHINVDSNSIVQCVKDNDVAYAAPGCNSDGIQIELAGFGKQTRTEWLDAYSDSLLKLAADATAQYCLKYNLPPIHLTNAQLAQGAKGIVGHYQVSAVYRKSDHTDPGAGFPWDYFIAMVGREMEKRRVAGGDFTDVSGGSSSTVAA